MSYKLIWKNNGFFVTLTANSSAEEINKVNGILHGDYRFDTHKYQIWNLLEADLSFINIEEASVTASIDSIAAKYVPGIKVALVVQERNAVKFSTYYIEKSKEFSSTWDIQIFNKMDNAAKWVQS